MLWQVAKRDPEVRRGLRFPRTAFFLFLAPWCEIPAKFYKGLRSSRDLSAALNQSSPLPLGAPGAGEGLAGRRREVSAAAWRGSRGPTWLLQELCYFATS